MTQTAAEPPVPEAPERMSPQRRRATLVAVGSAVLVVLVAAAGGLTYLQLRPVSVVGVTASAIVAPAVPVTTAPPPPVYEGDLRSLMLPKPASAKVTNSRPSTDGVVSIEQVVEGFAADSGMLNDLRDLGFKRGATKAWIDKGYGVIVDLYQFDLERHAAEFLVSTQRAYNEAEELDSTASLDSIAGGRWFVDKKLPGMKQQMSSLFHRGSLWVQIVVYCPTKPDVKILIKLATDQYNRLPAE